MRDTIDMMRDACDKDKVDAWQNGFWTITQEELKAFEALVRADEREACAKVCETLPPLGPYKEVQIATLEDAAIAIRARGNT